MGRWTGAEFEEFLDRYSSSELDDNGRIALRQEARDRWSETENEFSELTSKVEDLNGKYTEATKLNFELSKRLRPEGNAKNKNMAGEEENAMEKLIAKIKGE